MRDNKIDVSDAKLVECFIQLHYENDGASVEDVIKALNIDSTRFKDEKTMRTYIATRLATIRYRMKHEKSKVALPTVKRKEPERYVKKLENIILAAQARAKAKQEK